MRDVIVAANWKMHTTPADAGDLAVTLASRTQVAGVTRVIGDATTGGVGTG